MPNIVRALAAPGSIFIFLSLGTAAAAPVAGDPAPSVVAVATETPSPAADNAEIPATEPAPTPSVIANGTIVEIRLTEAVNSRSVKPGDWFGIALNQPVMLGDVTVLPEGVTGRGQIVHVAKSSWGGKAGELIVAARYLEFNGAQIPLRGMKLGGVGRNNEGLAFATSIAGGLAATPIIFALNGKNADLPEGTLASAKLAMDLPVGSADAPVAARTEPVTEPVAAPTAEPEQAANSAQPVQP
jgi:hypothetical protein